MCVVQSEKDWVCAGRRLRGHEIWNSTGTKDDEEGTKANLMPDNDRT